jgi:hypothetical protein
MNSPDRRFPGGFYIRKREIMKKLFTALFSAMLPAVLHSAVDCGDAGCKICERIICDYDRCNNGSVVPWWACEELSNNGWIYCLCGEQNPIWDTQDPYECIARCGQLCSGLNYEFSDPLPPVSCSTSTTIAVAKNSGCPNDYFMVSGCDILPGTNEKGAYKYICE